MSNGFEGRCLCGNVTYRSDTEPMLSAHCHCEDCRRSSGTGHGTHVVAAAQGFEITGEVRFYDKPADSGNVVSRGFCPTCGSPVLSKNASMPDMVFVRASSLDDPDILTPKMVVYANRAPAWDLVDPALPSFAGMPDAAPQDIIAEG